MTLEYTSAVCFLCERDRDSAGNAVTKRIEMHYSYTEAVCDDCYGWDGDPDTKPTPETYERADDDEWTNREGMPEFNGAFR